MRCWPNELFLLLRVFTSVPILLKIDYEMRLWESAQTQPGFIICPMPYAVAMWQTKRVQKCLKRPYIRHWQNIRTEGWRSQLLPYTMGLHDDDDAGCWRRHIADRQTAVPSSRDRPAWWHRAGHLPMFHCACADDRHRPTDWHTDTAGE